MPYKNFQSQKKFPFFYVFDDIWHKPSENFLSQKKSKKKISIFDDGEQKNSNWPYQKF